MSRLQRVLLRLRQPKTWSVLVALVLTLLLLWQRDAVQSFLGVRLTNAIGVALPLAVIVVSVTDALHFPH